MTNQSVAKSNIFKLAFKNAKKYAKNTGKETINTLKFTGDDDEKVSVVSGKKNIGTNKERELQKYTNKILDSRKKSKNHIDFIRR